jgi:hypothetical protein
LLEKLAFYISLLKLVNTPNSLAGLRIANDVIGRRGRRVPDAHCRPHLIRRLLGISWRIDRKSSLVKRQLR